MRTSILVCLLRCETKTVVYPFMYISFLLLAISIKCGRNIIDKKKPKKNQKNNLVISNSVAI